MARKTSSYEPALYGQWIKPPMRGYFLKCCDCSLVHRIDFSMLSGHLELRLMRDERKTAASRRKKSCRT